eukprot:GFUD01017972.1.p1 GENE.GFUD01017972.1~~GFUD01017972.1.p1  ORF type:complete len:408 (+),score=130.92 GFUD01017972.1:90-1226(+)
MSEPSYRDRDPRCSRASSLLTADSRDKVAIRDPDKFCVSKSSPLPHPVPSLAGSCPASILPDEKTTDKEYDPASPISDIHLSPSPVHPSLPPHSSPVPNSSFLVCVVCGTTPSSTPLYGCELSHIVCSICRSVGGSLLSCPRCGSQDISHHLTIAGELLEAELEKNCLVFCPYKPEGCSTVARGQVMAQHKEQCLFRPVKCPKSMFSMSCTHIGPLCTLQQHGRDRHNLHQGVTELELGVISSKMFDKGRDKTCCDDPNNAKFQPLELTYQDSLFYCYFERVADRGLWFFFIRMFGNQEQASMFKANIMIGHSGLERGDKEVAGLRYSGAVAHYSMTREEIRGKGMVLAVADEVLRSCKVGNVLFRVWFQVEEQTYQG